MLDELQQTLLQTILAGLGEFDEAEGLEPALCGPHGEHHFRLFADGGLPEVEDQFDFEFFVERLLHVHQATGGGKLMQFTAHFAPVGQAHQGQDRSTELDAERAIVAAG